MNEKLLYKIHVTGRVQGVGFRHNAASEARYLGIKGFVKNLADGNVYIEAEGTIDQLQTFINWCHKGPRFGFAESVKVEESTPVYYSGFNIKY